MTLSLIDDQRALAAHRQRLKINRDDQGKGKDQFEPEGLARSQKG